MTDMIEIIKKDVKKVAPYVFEGSKGAVKGVIKGLYSPFFIKTSYDQCKKTWKKAKEEEKGITPKFVKNSLDTTFHGIIGVYSYFYLALYAQYQGKWKEALGAVVLGNTIDYLIHTYKRSKKSVEEIK